MYKIPIFLFLGLVFLMFTFGACNKDQLPQAHISVECDSIMVSYNTNIMPIVDTYCSYSGCHDGSTSGVFTSYQGMLGLLDNGKIMQRAIITQDMPPNFAIPDLRELPDEEFQMFQCWLETGYPE